MRETAGISPPLFLMEDELADGRLNRFIAMVTVSPCSRFLRLSKRTLDAPHRSVCGRFCLLLTRIPTCRRDIQATRSGPGACE